MNLAADSLFLTYSWLDCFVQFCLFFFFKLNKRLLLLLY